MTTAKTLNRECYRWLTAPTSAALALLWVDTNLFSTLFHRELTGSQELVFWRDRRGRTIDQVLVFRTGDGVVLSLHGGPAVRHAADAELAQVGACVANVPNLWKATHPLATAAFEDLPHVQGELGAELLLACATRGEAALRQAAALPDAELQQVARAWAQARFLYEAPRVQLWGPVNAGKSSLLNALCGETLAAEGPEPGLTRDVIEGRMEQAGVVLRLFDAPGTGHDGSTVNQASLTLAEHWRREANLTLELVPPGATPSGAGAMHVYSRADQDPDRRQPAVSTHDAESLARLRQSLVEHFFGRLQALPDTLRVALPRSWLNRLAETAVVRSVIVP